MFDKGDEVERIADGDVGIVTGVLGSGLYEVQFLKAGKVKIHGDEIRHRQSAGDPADQLKKMQGELLACSIDYGLGLRARYLRHAYQYDPMSGLSNARIEPAHHQVYVAHRVTQKLQPRMILADEVGLGKTIEAGLVIKELSARGVLDRILVVCPASLQLQWQQEMRSKFNEEFVIIDGPAEKFLGKGDKNAFSVYPRVICSTPFASNPARADRILAAGWDLVVFDEAHRVRRTLQKTTQAYKMADELKEVVNGILLLSATPMQLHQYELYSLMEIAEPGLFPSYEAYDARRMLLPRLNAAMKALVNWDSQTESEKGDLPNEVEQLLPPERAHLVRSARGLDDAECRSQCIEALETRHPLVSVLVRNRKSVLETYGTTFSRREPTSFLVELTDSERALYEDITEYIRQTYGLAKSSKNNAVGFVMVSYQRMLTSSAYALRASMKRRIGRLKQALVHGLKEKSASRRIRPEMLEDLIDAEEYSQALESVEEDSIEQAFVEWEIASLEGFVQRLAKTTDSKARRLVEILDSLSVDHPDEKVLIFTQFIETQEFLRQVLEHNGYSVARFNGRMKLEEKEAAVRAFRGPKQILVSTEAGGEGRNFQFAHVMVNYDLPWNPMRVEQRIGRLDRFGQKKPVLIYNLAEENTLEERVLEVLRDRIKVFEESVGSLDPILGELEKDIERIVMHDAELLDEEFEKLDRNVEKAVLEAREKESMLADFALDRASLRNDEAADLLERSPLARHADLRAFVFDTLERHGGYLDDHVEGGQVVTLPPTLAAKLRWKDETVRGVFNPAEAVEHEDLDFLAFGHPLVERVLDLAADSTGWVGVRVDPAVGPEPLVEIVYQFEAVGVKPCGRMIRHVVGPDLVVTSETISNAPCAVESSNQAEVPDWVADAVRVSGERLAEEHAAELEAVLRQNEELKSEQLKREERLLAYRRVRLERVIADDAEWIEEKERRGSERDKKILPARKGKLAKNRARLERLQFDFDERAQEILGRQASVTSRTVSAGLLVGQ